VTSVEETKGIDPTFRDKEKQEKYTQQMLFRIYPHGLRFDSSNYNPLSFWGAGCQIVALNYHTDGFPMWLNEGKFMRAGRSGWILKPKHLRRGEEENNEGNEEVILEVTVISGWRLPRPWGTKTLYSKPSPSKPCKPRVEVSLWTPDSVLKFQRTKQNVKPVDSEIIQFVQVYYTKTNNDPHNPIFFDPLKDEQTDNAKSHSKQKAPGHCRIAATDKQPFKFVVADKELDMLVFKVFDNSEDDTILGVKTNTDANRVIGYYAITVDDLREGIRVVPLKGELGAPLLHGDLMVRINLKSGVAGNQVLEESDQIEKPTHCWGE